MVRSLHEKLRNGKSPWKTDTLAEFWNFQGKDVAKIMQANNINLIKIGQRSIYKYWSRFNLSTLSSVEIHKQLISNCKNSGKKTQAVTVYAV